MPSEYISESALGTFLALMVGASAAGAVGSKAASVLSGISNRKHGNVMAKNFADRNGVAFNTTSIARATKDLTMSFPMLCTDTISPSTANLLVKAVERNNVSMLQMFIAAYHISANNGIEAVRMIHTNMDNSFRAEDLIDAVLGAHDGYTGYHEMGEITTDYKRPVVNYARFLEEAKQEFLNSCNIKYPISSFSENSVADYLVSNSYGGVNVLKEESVFDDKDIAKEINKYLNNKDPKKAYKQTDAERDNISTKDAIKYGLQDRQYEYNKLNDKRNYDLNKDKFIFDQRKYKEDKEREDALNLAKSRRELFLKQLLDSDVKKANELQPTLMVVPFYYMDAAGNEQSHEFIAGVKSRLITCTSGEIIDQMSRFNKQGVNLNNLIRATTKEISFAKEFIGGIEQAKIDAKRDSKLTKTNPIWRMLQNRSSKSGIKSLIRIKGSKNAAAAITTLVISSQEADYLFENYKVDITNPMIAREFMENYNLLCLIIVDEQTEVAKFLYDGEKYFSEYSFSALDRDNNSNDTRKLISLLNKTR